MTSQSAAPHTWTAKETVVAVYYSCFGANEMSIKHLIYRRLQKLYTQREVHDQLEMAAKKIGTVFGPDTNRIYRGFAGTHLAEITSDKDVFEGVTSWSDYEKVLCEVRVTPVR